jgi:hypothetical protein
MSDDTKDVTQPYKLASDFAFCQAQEPMEGKSYVERVAYWAAWRAARNTAAHLLNKAGELGLTAEQIAALTVVAEEWAYD